MSKKNIGYIRISTVKQDLENQKHQILNYANIKKLEAIEFVEIQVSSRKSEEDRKIDLLLETLEDGDTLIIVELSRIERSVINVIKIINLLVEKNINIHIIKENMIIEPDNLNAFTMFQINIFSSFGQLERDLISFRTKEALRIRKHQGVILGRKKGAVIKSKYDQHKEKIQELHQLGLSSAKILKYLDIDGTQQSLGNFIKNKIFNYK